MSDADINHTEERQREEGQDRGVIFGQGLNMSKTIGYLAQALAKAQLEITGAVKDSTNPFFKSSYADLASVLEAMKPLHKYGLALIQMPLEGDGKVRLVTTLMHSSGEWMQAVYSMTPTKNDPQGIGSCLTYMRRYAASAFAGIAQVDDDGNAASQPVKKDLGKPMSGVKESLSSDVQAKLQLVADKVHDFMAESDIVNAVGIMEGNNLDTEQKIALWGMLDAPTRSAVKKYQAENTKAQNSAQQKTQSLRDAIK